MISAETAKEIHVEVSSIFLCSKRKERHHKDNVFRKEGTGISSKIS
jgi:hypothetical protein